MSAGEPGRVSGGEKYPAAYAARFQFLAVHLLSDDRAGDGLHGDRLEARLPLLDDLAHAGDRAAGADAGDEEINFAIRVIPDLLGCRAPVDLRVGGVLELLRHE